MVHKHYIENKRFGNMNPTKIGVWTWVYWKSKQLNGSFSI